MIYQTDFLNIYRITAFYNKINVSIAFKNRALNLRHESVHSEIKQQIYIILTNNNYPNYCIKKIINTTSRIKQIT